MSTKHRFVDKYGRDMSINNVSIQYIYQSSLLAPTAEWNAHLHNYHMSILPDIYKKQLLICPPLDIELHMRLRPYLYVADLESGSITPDDDYSGLTIVWYDYRYTHSRIVDHLYEILDRYERNSHAVWYDAADL